MFLDGGRKPENPRIHGENMQTPHRKNQPGIEPGTLCCEATVPTTTPPCSPKQRLSCYIVFGAYITLAGMKLL